MERRADKKAEMILLRGANGVLYKAPASVLEKFAVPPEDLEKVLQELREINPPLAAQWPVPGAPFPGGPRSEGQVVINIFTSPSGAAVRLPGEWPPSPWEVCATVTPSIRNIK